MTDLTERLIRLRDNLRTHSRCREDCDTLAEAANRVTELEAERDRYQWALWEAHRCLTLIGGKYPRTWEGKIDAALSVISAALSEQEGQR